MSKSRRILGRRSIGRIASSLAVGLALAAGGGGFASAQSTNTDTTKLIIGAGSSGISQVPLYIAIAQDRFKKAGIDVELQSLNGGTTAAMAAFANGSISILNLSMPELIQYTGNKVVSGKAFAELSDQSYDVVAAKGTKSFEEIKGKAAGVSALNSGDYIFLVALMQHYKIAPGEVTWITSGNPINRLAAISNGVVQFTAATNSLRDEATRSGVIVIKSADAPVGFPASTFIASSDFIQKHKPLLTGMVQVLRDTIVWMKSNTDEAAAVCAKALNAEVKLCRDSIMLNFDRTVSSTYTWSSTFAVNVEGVKSALAIMASIDPSTKGLKIEDVVDSSIAGTTP